MDCRILLFAQLADAVGQRELSLDLPPDSTANDALRRLARDHQSIAQLDGRIAIAINDRYATPDTQLDEGDVLALIPPVSGG